MHKIWLIIQREYLVRVRKKSFIVMTILAPLLMVALILAPAMLALNNQQDRLIAVFEEEGIISSQLEDRDLLHFKTISQEEYQELKSNFNPNIYYALLDIKEDTYTMFSNQQIALNTRNNIEAELEYILEKENLKNAGIPIHTIEEAESNINIITKIISEDGTATSSNSEISTGIGFMSGILIYIFIFMYGTMVMRGVIEEKTNRIIEVIISSVRPFQLMMGKIIGVALVGLTQFALWIGLTLLLSTVIESLFISDAIQNIPEGNSLILSEVNNWFGGINIIQILLSFIFYFLIGYLLYSALFAAVGSAVDAESDTQQFILPITIPLILSFILIQPIMENPDGALAFWLSIIPFTSPVIMMVRLPFGVPSWELALSMILLILGFLFTTWLASKIYRVGILMYGKKPSYKEIVKWITYKE
ncbi:MAG: ABC transporter permease [Bacteroidota bacterium]|nr:ABC transporter permease [Bacteroidota bacterium]